MFLFCTGLYGIQSLLVHVSMQNGAWWIWGKIWESTLKGTISSNQQKEMITYLISKHAKKDLNMNVRQLIKIFTINS